MDSRCSTYHRTCWTSSTDLAADTPPINAHHYGWPIVDLARGDVPAFHVRTENPKYARIRTLQDADVSWRLNERIIVCSVPRNDGAEGSFGRMKMESVHPGHWEERTRDGVLVPVDDCIRWYDHERIKRSLGWMSPVQYRQSQGMAA